MRNDVHFAALKAAAKVAFSVALLNGCSSAVDSETGKSDDGDKTDGTASSESAVTSGSLEPCPNARPVKPSCDAVLASAFPDPNHYQWEPVAQSAEVVACCDKELANDGSSSKFRWDCCVAYDPSVSDGGDLPVAWGPGHGLACTPWGPPVPPSMNRDRDRLARRRALRARSVAASSMEGVA